jgi:hypothetical protein
MERGMQGSGILGTVLSAAPKLLKPLAKHAMKSAKRAAIKQGIGLAGDLILGRNATRSAKTRAKKALKMTALSTLGVAQSSLGRRPARRSKTKKSRAAANKRATAKPKRILKKSRGQSGKGKKKRSPPGYSNKRMNNLLKQWRKSRK